MGHLLKDIFKGISKERFFCRPDLGARILTGIMAMVLAVTFCACGRHKSQGGEEGDPENVTGQTPASGADTDREIETWTWNDFVMSTVLTITVYGREDLTPEIKDRLDALEKEDLSWRDPKSTVAKVNNLGTEEGGYEVDPDFAGWLEKSLKLASDSGGAFDPSLGRLTRLWNIEGDHPKVPGRKELAKVMSHVGYKNIRLMKESHDKGSDYRILLEEGASLDFGAVGKGIGCDVVRDYLNKEEKDSVTGAVVSIGGSILVYGSKPDGTDWKVAIQDPRGADGEFMGTVSLNRDAVVSTSGDYEKYFEEKGVRYHHILDPHTGYPSDSGLISATVICQDGLLSDGLSTACFVLGREKGLELLEKYNAQGILIDRDKIVTITPGLEKSFSILNTEYKYHKK